MGVLPDLPAELIWLIVDHLHDDGQALRACALASRVFAGRSQAHLFKRIKLWNLWSPDSGGKTNTRGNTDAMRTYIPSDPDGLLSYTQSLSIFLGPFTQPQHLEEIYDHWIVFKNIRELQARLFATHFIEDLVSPSRYFSRFQPTLRRLHLKTSLKNPKDLIAFIAFFPLLEEVTIEMLSLDFPSLPDSKSEGFDPDLLSPLKGSLRLRQFRRENNFLLELAKVRIQYHTLSICDATWPIGLQEFIIACAPTLRVLNITRGASWILDVSQTYRDLSMNLTTCTLLTEINLPLPLQNLSSNIRHYSTILSNISSPHLQKITLILDIDQFIFDIRIIMNMLSYEEWQSFEDALLGVSSRSRNTLKVVVILPSAARAREIHNYSTFLARFREVGNVIFGLP